MVKKIGDKVFIRNNEDLFVGELLPPWKLYNSKEYDAVPLCKFYSISEEHNIDAIKNNYWYSTPPKLFNDFSDCNANLLNFENSFEKYYEWSAINNIEPDNKDNLDSYASESQNAIYNKNFGVTCFTRTINLKNHLMWANYANNHKGICLLYDSVQPTYKGLINIDNHMLLPVTYVRKNPLLKENVSLHVYPFVKYKCWRGEKEYRLIKFKPNDLSEDERRIYYNTRNVKAIYFGCRFIEHPRNQEILKIIHEKYPKIKIYKMELVRKSFKLNSVSVRILQKKGTYNIEKTAHSTRSYNIGR